MSEKAIDDDIMDKLYKSAVAILFIIIFIWLYYNFNQLSYSTP